MPKSSSKKSPWAIALALLALALVAAGCGGSGEPEAYNQTVEDNYVQGCRIPLEGQYSADDALEVCECAYEEIEDNVPFDDFKALDDDLREDINALDSSSSNEDVVEQVRGYIRTCIARVSGR